MSRSYLTERSNSVDIITIRFYPVTAKEPETYQIERSFQCIIENGFLVIPQHNKRVYIAVSTIMEILTEEKVTNPE